VLWVNKRRKTKRKILLSLSHLLLLLLEALDVKRRKKCLLVLVQVVIGEHKNHRIKSKASLLHKQCKKRELDSRKMSEGLLHLVEAREQVQELLVSPKRNRSNRRKIMRKAKMAGISLMVA
jgi:hypothetical protein